jgi:hypothetical protein
MSAHVITFKDLILGVGTGEEKVGIKVARRITHSLPLRVRAFEL